MVCTESWYNTAVEHHVTSATEEMRSDPVNDTSMKSRVQEAHPPMTSMLYYTHILYKTIWTDSFSV